MNGQQQHQQLLQVSTKVNISQSVFDVGKTFFFVTNEAANKLRVFLISFSK
jgi:hypothetical protein